MSSGWRLVRARRAAVPASVRRFALRARQRRLRALLPWLIVLAVLAVLAGLGAVVEYTSLFGVRGIEVSGVSVTSRDQVLAAAAVASGTPLAQVDTRAVAGRVEQLAPVRSAKVSTSWPNRLVIVVTERRPAAAVVAEQGFAVIDDTGVVFQQRAERPADLPLVRVSTPGNHDPATRAALTVLLSLPDALRTPLAELSAEAPTRLKLVLVDGRSVVWGDATENELKVRTALLLLARPGKVFDVSAPNVPTIR